MNCMRPTLLVVVLLLLHGAVCRPAAAAKPDLLRATRRHHTQQSSATIVSLRGGGIVSPFDGASSYVLTCVAYAASISTFIGYNIGSISGALFFIAQEFGLDQHAKAAFAAASAAAMAGALNAGVIADRFGRTPTLFISTLAVTAGSLTMALATGYSVLFVGRFIQGFGIGAGLTIAPMFIAEIAPPACRGALVAASQLALSLGILVAYAANVALSGMDHQW